MKERDVPKRPRLRWRKRVRGSMMGYETEKKSSGSIDSCKRCITTQFLWLWSLHSIRDNLSIPSVLISSSPGRFPSILYSAAEFRSNQTSETHTCWEVRTSFEGRKVLFLTDVPFARKGNVIFIISACSAGGRHAAVDNLPSPILPSPNRRRDILQSRPYAVGQTAF